ncbi:MAG: A/G-specific adenine glycosylase [Pseudomonadota bacterium]
MTITSARAKPQDLLTWYDRHHRELPWRVSPGARKNGAAPDPYRVWLSEIMLQQTTVAAVTKYFLAFTRRWPTVHALAAAPDEEILAAWAGLGYYARARNLIKCARMVSSELGGVFPDTEAALQELPGIGPYTSAAIAAIAFDRKATVLDGNVERVMSRLHAETAPLPGSKETLRGYAAGLTPAQRSGDYAQAVMDLGATICTPRKPACVICPWRPACDGHATGIADTLPRKAPKAAKPVRRGVAWVVTDPKGAIMTVRRPDKGLLGGMLAVPSSEWSEGPVDAKPPMPGEYASIGEVRHTFTHFHLILEVRQLALRATRDEFIDLPVAAGQMPTVFSKVCKLARL